MTAPASVDTSTERLCAECQLPMVSCHAWQRMDPELKAGKVRAGAHGFCITCYTRNKPKREAECAVDGCTDNVGVQDWCHAHYKRKLRYGSPTGGPPMYKRKQAGLDDATLARLRRDVGIPVKVDTVASEPGRTRVELLKPRNTSADIGDNDT